MKKLTLNQTWTLCLRMWRWIASVWKEGDDVWHLKEVWLENNWTGSWPKNHCFFCEYATDATVDDDDTICIMCPASLAKGSVFNCYDEGYGFTDNPPAFYAELLRLNRIRKAKK